MPSAPCGMRLRLVQVTGPGQFAPENRHVPNAPSDVIAALEVCRRFDVPLLMRGGGTSQAGQAIGEGIQIDTSNILFMVPPSLTYNFRSFLST